MQTRVQPSTVCDKMNARCGSSLHHSNCSNDGKESESDWCNAFRNTTHFAYDNVSAAVYCRSIYATVSSLNGARKYLRTFRWASGESHLIPVRTFERVYNFASECSQLCKCWKCVREATWDPNPHFPRGKHGRRHAWWSPARCASIVRLCWRIYARRARHIDMRPHSGWRQQASRRTMFIVRKTHIHIHQAWKSQCDRILVENVWMPVALIITCVRFTWTWNGLNGQALLRVARLNRD